MSAIFYVGCGLLLGLFIGLLLGIRRIPTWDGHFFVLLEDRKRLEYAVTDTKVIYVKSSRPIVAIGLQYAYLGSLPLVEINHNGILIPYVAHWIGSDVILELAYPISPAYGEKSPTTMLGFWCSICDFRSVFIKAVTPKTAAIPSVN